MRKAATHFRGTASVGVLRYQANLQAKAKRSEGLSGDFKPCFADQVSLAALVPGKITFFH